VGETHPDGDLAAGRRGLERLDGFADVDFLFLLGKASVRLPLRGVSYEPCELVRDTQRIKRER
jgi:hypothetical protein